MSASNESKGQPLNSGWVLWSGSCFPARWFRRDDYSVNPETGDVADPSGEVAGNLDE